MKLYANSTSLIKNKKFLEKLFSSEGNLQIIAILDHYFDIFKVHKILKKDFKTKPSYICNVKRLSRKIINFYENGKANLEIEVSHKLNTFQRRKLLKLSKATKIVDYCGTASNIEFYKNCNNLVFESAESNIDSAVAFDFGYFNHTRFDCKYSSCLGTTLYLDKKGDFFFCKKHIDESYLDNISNVTSIEELFNKTNFIEILGKSIEKRNKCKTNCKFFFKCNGGCPLESRDCETFIKNVNNSIEERRILLNSSEGFDDIPLYKKESLMKEISKYLK